MVAGPDPEQVWHKKGLIFFKTWPDISNNPEKPWIAPLENGISDVLLTM